MRVLSSQMIAIELPNHTMQQHATRTPKPSRVLPPLCAMRWFCAWARHCASLGVQTAHIDMQKDRQGSTKPVVAKAHAGPTVQDHPRGLGDGQHHPATARPWTTSSRRQRGASSFALRVSVAYRLSGKSLKLAELLHALLSDGGRARQEAKGHPHGTALPPPPSALPQPSGTSTRATGRPRVSRHCTHCPLLQERAKGFMLRSALLCHLLAGSVQQGLATSVECLPYRSDEALLDFSGAKPQRFLYCSSPRLSAPGSYPVPQRRPCCTTTWAALPVTTARRQVMNARQRCRSSATSAPIQDAPVRP